MRLANLLFFTALICALAAATIANQHKGTTEMDCQKEGGEIERKEDRFTGETTITLRPQPVTSTAPGQQLKMVLTYKVKSKERGRGASFIPEMIDVVFTSTSPSRIYDGEAALVFLIDGERVRPAPSAVHDDRSRLSANKVLKQTVFSGMSVETLRRISRAKTVEMKLGETEVKLNSELLTTIQLFAGCALNNK